MSRYDHDDRLVWRAAIVDEFGDGDLLEYIREHSRADDGRRVTGGGA